MPNPKGRKWNDDAKHPMIRIDLRFTPEDFERCREVAFANHPQSYFEHWCAHACLFFAWYEERRSELLRKEGERVQRENERHLQRAEKIHQALEEHEGPAVAAGLLSTLPTFDMARGIPPRARQQYRRPKGEGS